MRRQLRKTFLSLARRGVRGDVEVLGLAAEQQVAHAAAHEVGEVPVLFQLVEDPHGVVADPLAGDGMPGARNDRRF